MTDFQNEVLELQELEAIQELGIGATIGPTPVVTQNAMTMTTIATGPIFTVTGRL